MDLGWNIRHLIKVCLLSPHIFQRKFWLFSEDGHKFLLQVSELHLPLHWSILLCYLPASSCQDISSETYSRGTSLFLCLCSLLRCEFPCILWFYSWWPSWTHSCVEFSLGFYLVRFYTLLRPWGSLQSLLGWGKHSTDLVLCLCCSSGASAPVDSHHRAHPGCPGHTLQPWAAVFPFISSLFLSSSFSFLVFLLSLSTF